MKATREQLLKVINDLFDQHPDDEITFTEEIDYDPPLDTTSGLGKHTPVKYRITVEKDI